MAVCYIAGASPDAVPIHPRPGDFIIAADGGLAHLVRWGLQADLLVGDMDSLEAVPENLPRKTYPRKKDDTDLSLAIAQATARGFTRIIITGAWGGRPDHSMASLQVLAKAARQGIQMQLLCGEYTAAAITGGGILRLQGRGTVSVFAYGGPARGVNIRGLEYALENAALRDDTPLGVSNTLDGEGDISLEHGTLLLFYQKGICVNDMPL